MEKLFDYKDAFSRNIGWVTAAEQEILRHKRIAIAGMGGVGGSHLLTLTRLGIGAFHIADFDEFEVHNFNRQAGANMDTIGHSKVDVLAEMAKKINPELIIEIFNDGVNEKNLDHFLADVDVYVDGLDFFAVKARRMVFAACADKGIPAVTAAPIGAGAALLNFLPGRMTFEEYFRMSGVSDEEQLLRFLVGLAPAGIHRQYLVEPSALDIANHKGPSTPMGVELCAGVAATQVFKLLLNRGKVLPAPHGLQYDAFRNRVTHTWRPLGNGNPLHKLVLALGRKQIAANKLRQQGRNNMEKQTQTRIEKILDKARWAPSGDNTQPWRFEIKSDDHVVVHCFDTRDHVVYDLQGHASQISMGTLLETLSIAATAYGLRTEVVRRTNAPEEKPIFDVRFIKDNNVTADPLIPYIETRTVQRRPMSTRPLTSKQRETLENCLPEGYKAIILEGFSNRFKMAKLMFLNDKLRLSMPEAFEVHRSIIDWKKRFSEDKVPEQAIGVDYMTARIMQWTMKSWDRVAFMNKYFAGTLAPRIQLAFIPAIACAAHFMITAETEPKTIDDYVAGGRAVQRFWLTAAMVGLQFQPEVTPLIFTEYSKNNIKFTSDVEIGVLATRISENLSVLFGNQNSRNAVFAGRIGSGLTPKSRSLRRSLPSLQILK